MKKIIPCLDIKNGRVVKGVQFESLKDAGDPASCAKAYALQGADEIVLLDISATTENRKSVLTETIKSVRQEVSVPITVGGGISTLKDIEAILNAGATKVGINSASVKNPNLINEASKAFGSSKIVIAIDCKKVNEVYNVLINGGFTDTGLNAVDWAKEVERRGAGEILLTSFDKDGTKGGYDIAITKQVASAVSIPVIASGGVGKIEDFLEVFTKTNAKSALGASVFHFGELTVNQIKNYLSENGVQ
ncbi:MAG: imidazole glycerol phosphate synthase subunit HisF [Firmicutes bacterium]|nr:imidazole glycerol phosphate synthase subunit HisF [Bacillota bacterium]